MKKKIKSKFQKFTFVIKQFDYDWREQTDTQLLADLIFNNPNISLSEIIKVWLEEQDYVIPPSKCRSFIFGDLFDKNLMSEFLDDDWTGVNTFSIHFQKKDTIGLPNSSPTFDYIDVVEKYSTSLSMVLENLCINWFGISQSMLNNITINQISSNYWKISYNHDVDKDDICVFLVPQTQN